MVSSCWGRKRIERILLSFPHSQVHSVQDYHTNIHAHKALELSVPLQEIGEEVGRDSLQSMNRAIEHKTLFIWDREVNPPSAAS